MSSHSGHPGLDQLRLYLPFSRLDDGQLILVSAAITVEEKVAGRALFRSGDDDKLEYFLLSGSLNLTAKDGASRKVVAGEELARHPVARLRPRQYTAVAAELIRYFCIDKRILELIVDQAAPAEELYEINDSEMIAVAGSASLLESIQARLMDSSNWLLSHPAMVASVPGVLADAGSAAKKLCCLDPVLSFKLASAANSPILVNVRTEGNGGLGLNDHTLCQLADVYSYQTLVHTGSQWARRLLDECRRSVEIAALCAVIVRSIGGVAEEDAILAGLFHNIGTVLLLQYVIHRPELQQEEQLINELIAESGQVLGAWGLEYRHFPDQLINAVIDCRDVSRVPESPACLSDILSLALLIDGAARRDPSLPRRLHDLPLLALLGDGFNPQTMLAMLQQARQQAAAWHNPAQPN